MASLFVYDPTMQDDAPEGMRRTSGGLFVQDREPSSYWKESTSSPLTVPSHVDTSGFDRTCVAPGPLGDPGRRRFERYPSGLVPVNRLDTCSSYVGKSSFAMVLSTGGRCGSPVIAAESLC